MQHPFPIGSRFLHGIAMLCLLFFALSTRSLGQDTVVYTRQIKFTPIKLIDFMNPGIEITYEQRVARRFSIQAGGAYLHDVLGITPYQKYDGFRVLAEGKYLIPVSQNVSFYTGADLTYNYTAGIDEATFSRPATPYPGNRYEDTFSIMKNTMSLNLKGGVLVTYHHFVVDFAMGLGVKYRDAKISGRKHPEDPFHSGPDINLRSFAQRPGAGCIFNMPMTIRIGYCF